MTDTNTSVTLASTWPSFFLACGFILRDRRLREAEGWTRAMMVMLERITRTSPLSSHTSDLRFDMSHSHSSCSPSLAESIFSSSHITEDVGPAENSNLNVCRGTVCLSSTMSETGARMHTANSTNPTLTVRLIIFFSLAILQR